MSHWEPTIGEQSSSDDSTPVTELGSPVPGEVFTEYNPYDYTMTIGPDGLPVEDMPPWQSQDAAPIPLTPETMHCLPQDKSAWDRDGLPACKYYKRQRVHNPQAPERPMIQRFCTHQSLRGINGAALTLDDAGIFDCEFRFPPSTRASVILDRIDSNKIVLGRERLVQEASGKGIAGFRMFRTPEDVAAGRYVLDEDDKSVGEMSRKPPKIDPMGEDIPAREDQAGEQEF